MRFSTLIMIAFFGMIGYSVTNYLKRGSPVYPPANEMTIDNRAAVIVIHGYYGSALRDITTKRRHFVAPSEVLFGRFNIGLFGDRLKTSPSPQLEVEGMIGRVTLLPFLYEVSAYASLIEHLKETEPGKQIIPFSYDWRGDLYDAVVQLGALIKLLQDKQVPKIQIVAHSMGGLIATYYIGYGTQEPGSAAMSWEGAKNVSQLVLLGTPFQGVMTVFRNMEKGADFPVNKEILPAETVASFPSSYYLLPTGTPAIIERGGNSANQVLYLPAMWTRYRLGLLKSDTTTAEVRSERERFIEERLIKAHQFSELVQLGKSSYWAPPSGFRVLNVIGKGRATLDGTFLDGDKFLFDKEEVAKAGLLHEVIQRDGDGTVAVSSAAVPKALEAVTEVMRTDERHDSLWSDRKVLDRINGTLD